MTCRAPVTDPRVLAIYKGVGTRDPAWSDFVTFQAWAMANGYEEHLTLDRIDFNLGYWPANCRWITISAQQRNKSNNVTIEIGGERMILIEAEERFGVGSSTIRKRLASGWPGEMAVQQMNSREAARLYAEYAQ